MIELAQQQIAAQKETARQIALSNLAGAQVIVNELNHQTNTLSARIAELTDRLSDGLSEATEKITYALDRLGDDICASLDEIRWQLVQQGKTLDQILRVLVESRNNEAQQLVRQGVRLCATEEYKEAEQVFKEALTKDQTDYQVLMNLAFIEIHKGNAQAAFDFFRKALTRPDPSRLDDVAKSRALWATARLHYAEGQYAEALKTANRALALEKTPTGDALLTTGVYAGRAGDADLCLKRIRGAVETDRAVFAKAAVAPGFGKMRADVIRLLSQMASAALTNARQTAADARKAVGEVAKGKHASSYQDLLATVRAKIDQAVKLLESASYAGCLDVSRSSYELRQVIAEIVSLELLFNDHLRIHAEATENELHHQDVLREDGTLAEENLKERFDFLLVDRFSSQLSRWLEKQAWLSSNWRGRCVESFEVCCGFCWWVLSGLLGSVVSTLFLGEQKTGLAIGMVAFPLACTLLGILQHWAEKMAKRDNAVKRQRIAESETRLRESRRVASAAEREETDLRDQIARHLSAIEPGRPAVPTKRSRPADSDDAGTVADSKKDEIPAAFRDDAGTITDRLGRSGASPKKSRRPIGRRPSLPDDML